MAGRIAILAVASEGALAEALSAELGEPYTLVRVKSADAAARELRAGIPFDLALVDERLGGIGAASQLAAISPHLPILLLAATPESRDVTAAISARQLVAAVQVPWRPGELAATAARAYELGTLRRRVDDLRVQMHRRLDALTALNDVTAATSDQASYDEVARAIAQGLFRIVRLDAAAVLLAPDSASAAVLHLHCQEPCSDRALRALRDRCLEVQRAVGTHTLAEDQLVVHVSGEELTGNLPDADRHDFTHVPIQLDGGVVGVIAVCGRGQAAFSREDERLLYFVANRTADTLSRLAARLHDERRRLSLMVESMADGLILTDTASEQVLINPAARQMLGIDERDTVTTQYLKDRLGFYPFDLVATRPSGSGGSQLLREEVRVGDQLLHSIVSPVRDGAGRLVGVVVVLRDMTEARELARRQHEFVSVVSHELRTPLTSITGALDILLSGYTGRFTDKQTRYLRMARESCSRLNTIVDDLLDVARSEGGRMPVRLSPLGLDDLGEEVVGRYRAAAEAKRVRLSLQCEDRGIRIMGDGDRLTQVLNNLLSNAIKFTPEGGNIVVEVFGPSVASEHVGVSVFNDGEPIPVEARERVFDKFEQLEDSSVRRVGGTGLGLAISRAIVEAHGGRIWVESDSAGTKFIFTLPAAPSGEDGTTPTPAEADRAGSPAQVESDALVLVIDDDQYSTYILKGMLMAAGHQVVTAEDADTALSLARSMRPALAVVDAAMQSVDSLALVEIFKHDPDTRKMAVLVISPTSQRDQAIGVGADEFLCKPLQPSTFRDTCSRLIAEAGRARIPRILVVDDDTAIRTICRDVLESAGYAVRDVPDGATALALAKRFRPDLMLLDVMMPNLDGFQTAERFRAESATSMTPIIFVSAKGETADKVRAFRSGAEDYVVKPFDAAELLARVAKALERHARELGASPTTQLPGADAIEAEIDRRLREDDDYAFCYLDLDNLKAFNDYYGYAKADGVIRQTGDLIRDIVGREGEPGDFIGHIAGDDFVFITTADRVDRMCSTICVTFDRLVPLYYNKVDRERGYIETKDRYGVLRKFPIMSVSLAAVTSGQNVRSFGDLAAAAARGKKLAKSVHGSSYVRDDRVVIGAAPAVAADHEVA